MRIAAAMLIMLCCSLEGLRRSGIIKRRVRFLDEIINMLTEFSIEIRFRAPTLEELLRNQTGEFALMVSENEKNGYDVVSAWEKACSYLPKNSAELALLSEFGRSFGRSDSDGELQLLGLYTERFSKLREEAFSEYSRKGKAFVRVGVLCGAAAAVLIL